MNKITTVDLYISKLIEDLGNGLSWFKRDDMGNGSIQEKYDANEIQLNVIKKHPKLVGVESCTKIFRVIDDLKESDNNDNKPQNTSTREPESRGTDVVEQQQLVSMGHNEENLDTITSNTNSSKEKQNTEEFFQL